MFAARHNTLTPRVSKFTRKEAMDQININDNFKRENYTIGSIKKTFIIKTVKIENAM